MHHESDMHDYQLRAVDFALSRKKCALWLGLGLGKTVTSLTAATRFNGPTLVIAPLRVAKNVWHTEAANWEHLTHLTFSHILGTPGQRLAGLETTADIYLINRENVAWLVETCNRNWPFPNVIIDESSSFKNHRAKRFRALLKVVPEIDRIVELTATPAANSLTDVWPQVRLLDGEALGKNVTAFRNKYCRSDWSGYQWSVRPDMVRAVHKAVKPFVLTMSQEEYITLPDRIDRTVPVILPSRAKAFYTRLRRDCIAILDETEVVAETAGVLAGKLQQVASGALYDGDGGWSTIHDAKLDALCDIVEHAQSPIIVVYHYRHDLARIRARIPQAVLIGDNLTDWNSGDITVLLVHAASAGHGLNLQSGGHTLVWFSIPWSLELYDQMCGRLHRQGQEHPVTVHHLVTEGTIDEAVVRALAKKSINQSTLIQAVRGEDLTDKPVSPTLTGIQS